MPPGARTAWNGTARLRPAGGRFGGPRMDLQRLSMLPPQATNLGGARRSLRWRGLAGLGGAWRGAVSALQGSIVPKYSENLEKLGTTLHRRTTLQPDDENAPSGPHRRTTLQPDDENAPRQGLVLGHFREAHQGCRLPAGHRDTVAGQAHHRIRRCGTNRAQCGGRAQARRSARRHTRQGRPIWAFSAKISGPLAGHVA
jgi:hypothetical protein